MSVISRQKKSEYFRRSAPGSSRFLRLVCLHPVSVSAVCSISLFFRSCVCCVQVSAAASGQKCRQFVTFSHVTDTVTVFISAQVSLQMYVVLSSAGSQPIGSLHCDFVFSLKGSHDGERPVPHQYTAYCCWSCVPTFSLVLFFS